jgi:hypothetical protein
MILGNHKLSVEVVRLSIRLGNMFCPSRRQFLLTRICTGTWRASRSI